MEALRENSVCPADEIAAYIDGELDAAGESEMEVHFAACASCAEELNLQKQFLCSLESSLKGENDLELPADFTKHVVANAESSVTGLRPARERFNAVFICAALLLFVLFALGADAGRALDGAAGAVDRLAAVGSLLGHFIYSFFLGVIIIMRAFATQMRPEAIAAGLTGIVVVAALAFVFRTRRV